MPALLDHFRAAGVELVPYDDGNKLRAFGELTDELRQAIRASRPAILAELAAATYGGDVLSLGGALPGRPLH